jgi:hypothetical protein
MALATQRAMTRCPELRLLVHLALYADRRDVQLMRLWCSQPRQPLVLWFENGRSVYGFATAEQAAAFRHWVDTCGIDWSTRPRDGPIPDFEQPPERPLLYGPTPQGRQEDRP